MRMQNGMTFWVSLRNASFFMKNVDKTMYSGAATYRRNGNGRLARSEFLLQTLSTRDNPHVNATVWHCKNGALNVSTFMRDLSGRSSCHKPPS